MVLRTVTNALARNGCGEIRLYSRGAVAKAVDGWSCATDDWTCEAGTTIGIERYAALVAAPPTASAMTAHEKYESPPEHAAGQ